LQDLTNHIHACIANALDDGHWIPDTVGLPMITVQIQIPFFTLANVPKHLAEPVSSSLEFAPHLQVRRKPVHEVVTTMAKSDSCTLNEIFAGVEHCTI
jgi:hypothetical protein